MSTAHPSAFSERSLREKYDRLHAESIRMGMGMATTSGVTKPSALSPTSSLNRPHELIIPQMNSSPSDSEYMESVNQALAGLDEAEQLREDGDYSQAMDLYEKSIGELISHLKTIDNHLRPREGKVIDRTVLAARVKVALTDAEQLKEEISNGKRSKNENNAKTDNLDDQLDSVGRQNSSSTPKSNALDSKSTITSSIYSVLGIGKSRSHEPDRRGIDKQQSRPGGLRSRNKSATAMLQERKKSNNDHPKPLAVTSRSAIDTASATNSKPTQRNINEAATQQPQHRISSELQPQTQQQQKQQQQKQRKKRSNLNYNNNPLVDTIKTELYVDRSQMKTKWDDVVGLESAKRALQEAVILPLIRPDLYTGLRCPPRGICLYGSPGTGKTMLVRAAAHESQCILFACTASALTSKWHGEGEKLLRTLFAVASDAAPSILFFDEIDALLSSRSGGGNEHEASRRFKTEFMVQMDGIISGSSDEDDLNQRLLVIGCTNCPWDLDEAVMRRFQRRIHVPLPDKAARRYLLNKLLEKEAGRHSLSMSQIENIVDRTEGYSCSDISSTCQYAAFIPLREMGGIAAIRDCHADDLRLINARDFKEAIKNTKKSVSNVLLEKYQAWEDQQSASNR
mmetsp:Transcript_30381/g.60580  ORF Transcript_30381/g.60580 Transcript_30381/m.60580 type:complete len:625 (-) Transcript_30381:290-2164(-)